MTKKKTSFKKVLTEVEKEIEKEIAELKKKQRLESDIKRAARNKEIDFQIARVKEICLILWSRKTSETRYKFNLYSEVLTKIEWLIAQKQKNSKLFNELFKKLQSFE